mmetsp:Transcript_18946/g.28588  ORF Transcript_18946/g.28588 Transcript_18946/m.28588 type:complete len:93 (-) Transcript_18946:195-473(-)
MKRKEKEIRQVSTRKMFWNQKIVPLKKPHYRDEHHNSVDTVHDEKTSPSDSRPNSLQKDQIGIERKKLESDEPFTGLITDDMGTLIQVGDEL